MRNLLLEPALWRASVTESDFFPSAQPKLGGWCPMPLACDGRNGFRHVRFVAQPLPVCAPDESHYRQM